MKKIDRICQAQKKDAPYTQEQANKIIRQAATTAKNDRIEPINTILTETGAGLMEDKKSV